MRRSLFLLLLAALGACNRAGDETPYAVQIAPMISTRVTGLYFDAGDRIGLKMIRGAENYQLNTPLTYNGTAFTAEGLLWYPTDDVATLNAYYPYSDAGFPDEFSVATDQRAGCESSDLLGAVKRDVQPAATPVGMLFNHLLSQLSVVVTNESGRTVTDVVVSGFSPTATLDWTTPAATVKSGTPTAEVGAFCVTPGSLYRVVLVPQLAALTVKITTDDSKIHTKTISVAQLDGGKRYDLAVTVTRAGLTLTLSGEIGDWGEGGSLGGGGGNTPGGGDGGDPDGELVYEGVTYRTATVGGKVWMAENLRYRPAGAVLTNDIWHPVGNAANETTMGMLYNRTTALAGGTVPPIRGICPAGWHIPDADEAASLQSGTPAGFFICAGWWSPITNNYFNVEKGLLMTTALTEGKSIYLSISEVGVISQKSLAADLGVSVRCVKD